jgi:hypothetical protein
MVPPGAQVRDRWTSDKQLQPPFPAADRELSIAGFRGLVLQQRFADEEVGFSNLCFGYLDLIG